MNEEAATFAGTGFPNSEGSEVTIVAAGSPCLVKESSRSMLRCLTTEAVQLTQPFVGNQGVRRMLWRTNALTTDPDRALSLPDTEANLSENLSAFSAALDDEAVPSVQLLTSILTLPADFSGTVQLHLKYEMKPKLLEIQRLEVVIRQPSLVGLKSALKKLSGLIFVEIKRTQRFADSMARR